MAISEDRLSRLFPTSRPVFCPPFYVETDDHDVVHIYDSNNARLTTFCTHTQLPIDDDRAIAAEIAYWQAEAERLVAALNASYPTPQKDPS